MAVKIYTRYASGLEAWPNDELAQVPFGTSEDKATIEIPVYCWNVETIKHAVTGDSSIHVMTGEIENDVARFIPRGGSVVIEVCE